MQLGLVIGYCFVNNDSFADIVYAATANSIVIYGLTDISQI